MKFKEFLGDTKEEGFSLVNLMMMLFIMGFGMLGVLVLYVIPTDYNNRLIKLAGKIEVWSVSNPTNPPLL